MKHYFSKLKIFLKELGNAFTNILCPLASMITAILNLIGAPIALIEKSKKLEYWFWNLSGTKNEIEKFLENKYSSNKEAPHVND